MRYEQQHLGRNIMQPDGIIYEVQSRQGLHLVTPHINGLKISYNRNNQPSRRGFPTSSKGTVVDLQSREPPCLPVSFLVLDGSSNQERSCTL